MTCLIPPALWRGLTIVVVASGCAGAMMPTASAQMMTSKAKKPKPVPVLAAPAFETVPVPAAFNWSGWYVGGFAGGAHGLWTNDFYRNNNHGHAEEGMDGIEGGGWFGYNMYVAPGVIAGLEGDFGKTNASENNNVYDNDTTYGAFNSFGSIRGRLGYTLDNVMLYGTAGLAFANITEDLQKGRNAGEQLVWDNQMRTGYAIGAGAEYAITNHWLARAEYLYENFGTVSLYNADNQLAEFNNQLHQLRVGVSYKF
jgi:outer membrane immunogenic protein